ncbi:MAG: hypothetical protein CMN32_05335 [Saprospirales bacterium]|nr:hypothetical protein [Saprospirales bacterium]
MNERMRMLIPVIIVALSVSCFVKCGSNVDEQASNMEALGVNIDSTRILHIIAFRDTLLNRATLRQENKELNPSIFEGENRFDYLTWEDGSAMYHGRFITDSSEVRTMFFLQDGKVVNANYRAFFTRPVRMAKEALLYYDENEKLFFVEDHSMLLQENELPALLKNQPFMASTRPLEEWEEEILPYKVKTLTVISEEIAKGN